MWFWVLGILSSVVATSYFGQQSNFTSKMRLKAKDKRFIRYAILLEAQQVLFYDFLAKRARRVHRDHLATGLEKAMLVEKGHLEELRRTAKRLRVGKALWTQTGYGFGRMSGILFRMFSPKIALKVISTIETKAARDYEKAQRRTRDPELRRLFLSNQVDEELHAAWAKELGSKRKPI